jgi:preprotein translocase subunit SecY
LFLWLSEIITDYGLGNGASLLIYINIISNLPNLSKTIISENLTFFAGLGFILLIFGSLYGIVFLQEGVRSIPLISSKQLTQGSGQDSLLLVIVIFHLDLTKQGLCQLF